MFAMFITSPAPETPLEPADEDLEVEPGQVVRLDPGEDVSTPATPDFGSTYEPFQYRTLLQISAALGVPYGYLTNDTAKGNFSNTRISLVDFRRRISAWQHGVLVYQMCRAVWTRWMDMAVLSGALELPDYDANRRQYQACMWLPTKWGWVDPMKDASAEILQIEAGLKSRTQALSERGYDAEQVEREIAAERKCELALGLDFRRPGSPAQAPGQWNASSADNEGEADDADQENSKRRSDIEADKWLPYAFSNSTPWILAALRSKVTNGMASARRIAAAIIRSAKPNPSSRYWNTAVPTSSAASISNSLADSKPSRAVATSLRLQP
jgi:capsid protein